MNYEKKYKEALELARVAAFNGHQSLMEGIFPELKESEDERIRKAIIEGLRAMKSNFHTISSIKIDDAINWLEKQKDAYELGFTEGKRVKNQEWLERQGEQKPKDRYTFNSIPRLLDMIEPTDRAKAYCQKLIDSLLQEGYSTDAKIVGECLKKMNGEDVPMATMDEKQDKQESTNKVEPKFKIGDWIIYRDEGCTEIFKISGVTETHYICIDISDDYCRNLNINFIDNHNYHLWTIADARDGDVLATLDYILIFEKIFSKNYGVSHCHYGFGNTTPQFNFNKDDNWYFGKEPKVYPATKEQRDLLFSKMHEAGYEWDAEKKELKKIEQHLISNYFNAEYERGKADALKSVAWSEEDEKMMNSFLHKVEVCNLLTNKENVWIINKLKSIKPQNTWKPSDEQMDALYTYIYNPQYFNTPDPRMELVISVYEDLKKLKGE